MQQNKFDPLIQQLEQQMKVTEWQFASSAPLVGPLVAAFRRAWNNVSTRWVLHHYAKQQLEFQHTLLSVLREMQQAQTALQQQLDEANRQLDEVNRHLISLENTNARTAILHETFNRDLEMLAKHSLRQAPPPQKP